MCVWIGIENRNKMKSDLRWSKMRFFFVLNIKTHGCENDIFQIETHETELLI